MSLIEELKRRNVFKVGAAYVVLAWLLAQGADLAADTFAAPDWVMKMLVTLLVLALPLVLFFAWAYELTPEGIKKEKDVDRSQSITPKTGRKLDFMIIGFLIVALGYFIWESRFSPTENPSPEIPAQAGIQEAGAETVASGATPEISAKSIAVLPFVNMSSDPEQEYFSDGISEEILNALARVDELKVAGRTSSFAFKGRNEDLRTIGEALRVANILEGSVRKSGNQLRITAQLIKVDDGYHLWSATFDREMTDVFAIQDEIASAILVELKAHLLDGEPKLVASERTVSEAYDLYLLARQRIYERKQLSIESAAELLDQAIALDSNYAPAYAQRGITALLLSDSTYGTMSNDQAGVQAKPYIDRALELDPGLAEAWAALGLYHQQRPGEHQQAIEVLEKALTINPNLIDASNWLQNAYSSAGREAEALQVLEDMVERDPLYPPATGNIVNALLDRGMLEQAAAAIDRVRPYMPADAFVLRGDAMVLLARGEFARGMPLLETALAQQPDNAVVQFALGDGLYKTQQYERLANSINRFSRVWGLHYLGRKEEAGMLAQELEAEGAFGILLALWNLDGKYEEVVRYVESHWASLEQLEAAFPASGYDGYGLMVDIAFAYQRTGSQQRFDDAMQRIRRAHDKQIALGAKNDDFFVQEAGYYALAGDWEKAIDRFELAVEYGLITDLRFSQDYPFLEPLEGNPRFEAARTRMIEHLNRERLALGLEPVSA